MESLLSPCTVFLSGLPILYLLALNIVQLSLLPYLVALRLFVCFFKQALYIGESNFVDS